MNTDEPQPISHRQQQHRIGRRHREQQHAPEREAHPERQRVRQRMPVRDHPTTGSSGR